jgi:hypothetical protein
LHLDGSWAPIAIPFLFFSRFNSIPFVLYDAHSHFTCISMPTFNTVYT